MRNKNELDDVEQAYLDVITNLSPGLLVEFNTGENTGDHATPELRVEVAGYDNVLLTEPPDRGVCDWEVRPDRDGRVSVFRGANTERPTKYAEVVTITVQGYSD